MQKLKFISRLSWLFAALSIVALSACNSVVDDATTIDKKAPSVSGTNPVNGAANAPVAAAITATFSEKMDAASITTSTFTINGVTGTVSYDAASKTATFVPASALAYNTTYTGTITTGATDKLKNPPAADFTWTFTTGTRTVTPTESAKDVAVNSTITVAFNEAMNATSINDTTFTVNGVTGAVTYDAATMTATLTPSTNLLYTTTYTVNLSSDIKSSIGVPFAAYQWNFETKKIARFAYVSAYGDGTIPQFGLNNATGQLRTIGYTPQASGVPSGGIRTTAHPNGKFIYRANYTAGNSISAFSIDNTTGRLTEISGSPFATVGIQPWQLVVDPKGRFAYAMNYASGSGTQVDAYSIDSTTGVLTAITGSPFTTTTGMIAGAIDPNGKYLYIFNYGGTSTTISGFSIDGTTGALTAISGSPFAAGGTGPFAGTFDPTGGYLYVALNSGFVAAFSVDQASGALSTLTGSPFAAGSSVTDLEIDPTGRFLYTTNSGSANISAYTIDQTTHALTAVAGSPFTAGSSPYGIAIEPTGEYLYVSNFGTSSSSVVAYAIDQTSGALTQKWTNRTRVQPIDITFTNGTAPLTYGSSYAYATNSDNGGANASVSAFSASTTGLLTALSTPTIALAPNAYTWGSTVDPFGKFLYTANRVGNLTAFAINSATGDLVEVTGSPFTAGTTPFSVAIDPYGRFLYASNFGSASVSAYAIDGATGALSEATASGSPFPAGTSPWLLSIDPSGRFAYVPNYGGNSISMFGMNQTSGALSALAGSPLATGASPTSTVVDPAGRFLFAAISGTTQVQPFSINVSTGVLSAGAAIATGGTPISVAVDPSGRFLYVANFTATSVSAFSIDASSGALTAVAGSPFTVGSSPRWVNVSPSGEFLYVANSGSNTISMFGIDQSTGALSALSTPTVATGVTPTSIVTAQPWH